MILILNGHAFTNTTEKEARLLAPPSSECPMRKTSHSRLERDPTMPPANQANASTSTPATKATNRKEGHDVIAKQSPAIIHHYPLTNRNVRQRNHSDACTSNQNCLRTTRKLLDQLRSTGLVTVGGTIEGGSGTVGGWFVPDFDHCCCCVLKSDSVCADFRQWRRRGVCLSYVLLGSRLV